MTIESALFSYLSTKAEVIAQVGTKIYPQVAPEGAVYPFITYTVISDSPEHHMLGASGLTEVGMQLDIWANKISERVTISEVLRNVLDGFTGNMGTENLNIRTCFLESRQNFEETDLEGKQAPIVRTSMDFSIWHVESLPTL